MQLTAGLTLREHAISSSRCTRRAKYSQWHATDTILCHRGQVTEFDCSSFCLAAEMASLNAISKLPSSASLSLAWLWKRWTRQSKVKSLPEVECKASPSVTRTLN